MKTKKKPQQFCNSWESHNIPEAIGRYAERLGLDCIATGGGEDFIYKKFPCGVEAVLGDGAGCPKTLGQPTSVVIYHPADPDESGPWMNGVEYGFKNARAAMRWMASVEPVCAFPVAERNVASEHQRLAEMFRKKHEKMKSEADWAKYTKRLGVKLISCDIRTNTLKPRDLLLDLIYQGEVGDNVVVDNPGRHRGYILVPRDLVLKALVLEDLP